jgi:hypothetical protein
VLVLANSWCPKCSAWSAELESFLAADERQKDVRFGRIYLNRWRLREFERSNPWLEEIDELPHNVLFVNGELRKSWPGGGIQRLLDRLEGDAAQASRSGDSGQ